MRKLIKIVDDHLEEFFLFPGLAFLVFALGFDVFRRYVLNNPGVYTSELATFAFVWIVYIGVPYGVKTGRHITLDLLPETMNPKYGLIIDVLSRVIQFVFFIFMAVQTIKLINFNRMVNMVSDAMAAPLWIVLLCFPIGFGLGALRLIQSIVNLLRKGEG